ncbi:hypothetical protein RQP46_008619 [Phenoliferia psychrophenolica]
MTQERFKVAIIGSGNWGTAISKVIGEPHVASCAEDAQLTKLSRALPTGQNTLNQPKLFEKEVNGRPLTEQFNEQNENIKYLPGIKISKNVVAHANLLESVKGANALVFVVPHQYLPKICTQLKGHISPNARAISLVKGIDVHESRIDIFADMIEEILQIPCSALSGANIANEVALNEFSETTIGCRDPGDAQMWKSLFHTPNFRVQLTDDVRGVSLAGALKNVVAIAAGMVDGLQWGNNAKAAIMRIGLLEMRKFSMEFFPDVRSETFVHESAGVADLITSCLGGRNRKVAEAFVTANKSFDELEAELLQGQKLQGVVTARELHVFLKARGKVEDYPLFTAVYRIAYEGVKPEHQKKCDGAQWPPLVPSQLSTRTAPAGGEALQVLAKKPSASAIGTPYFFATTIPKFLDRMSDNVEVPNATVIEMQEVAATRRAGRDADAVPSSTLTAREAQELFHLANTRRRSSSDLRRDSDQVQFVDEPAQIGGTNDSTGSGEAGSSGSPRTPHLFDLAHSRKSSHHHVKAEKEQMHVHGFDHPLSWRHLFKPPVVRQWLAGGVLARETAERELFFDLAFVGVIHQLAEGASESESSWAIFKFISFFFLGYSVTRSFINTSGTDDVPQRVYVLLIMVLLMGYSSNASAVKIECPVAVTEGVAETAARLFRRAVEGAVESGTEHASGLTILPGGCELSDGWRKNKCSGYWIPRFRDAHVVRAISIATGTAFYIPLLFDISTVNFVVLPVLAITLELVGAYSVALTFKAFEAMRRALLHYGLSNPVNKKEDLSDIPAAFTPALNLEHIIERNALFVVLVLGEMIINITFQAVGASAGIHEEYLRCVFGLLIAYSINWIYATASLVLASAALPTLITTDNPSKRIRFYYGGGLGTTMLTLALLGFMHKSLDEDGSAMLSHHYRLVARVLVGVIFATLPLANLSSTGLLGIYAGALLALVVAETVGKLGSRGSETKIKQALAHNQEGESNRESKDLHPEESFHLEAAMGEEGEHGLTEHELGEDDVGNEGALGNIKVTRLGVRQRLAYAF